MLIWQRFDTESKLIKKGVKVFGPAPDQLTPKEVFKELKPLLIGDKIKKPMSRELLFGKLAHGGSVLVTVMEDDIKLEYMASASLPDSNAVENIFNFETVK